MDHAQWLIDQFAAEVRGVELAAVVAADGVVLGISAGLTNADAERLAAITSGAYAFADAAAGLSGKGGCGEVILRMTRGHLLLMPIGADSRLAVLTEPSADMKRVSYEMTRLVEGVGHALSPGLRPASKEGA
jgi:predicted regulator of Ras-like GTPase activity (Roadblock/LC7/MglB family)